MNIIQTELPGVIIFEPKVFSDPRGFFMETWAQARYAQAGIPQSFVQDNLSFSKQGTLRGLHFQHPSGQGKLVMVISGEVLDVAVDVRTGSPTFGKWFSVVLSGDNHRQMYIPDGFAHGFCVISQTAIFSYKCTTYYNPSAEGGIIFNDPDLAIVWPVKEPVLSGKDLSLPSLRDIPHDKLPAFGTAQ